VYGHLEVRVAKGARIVIVLRIVLQLLAARGGSVDAWLFAAGFLLRRKWAVIIVKNSCVYEASFRFLDALFYILRVLDKH
jgi:hypothetical protein